VKGDFQHFEFRSVGWVHLTQKYGGQEW